MSKLNEQKIQQFFNDKIHNNMKLANNEYGCEFYTLYYNDFVVMDIKKIIKNGITCIKEYSNGKNTKPVYQTVTDKNFSRFFESSYKWEEFTADLLRIKNQFIKDKLEEQKNDSVATSTLMSLKDDGNDIRYKSVNLFSQSKFSNSYNKEDNNFIFDKTFRDEQNNLYMKLNDKLFLLRFKQNAERELLGNSTEKEFQFWPDFFKENKNNFEIWQDKIKNSIETYDKDSGISLEETIMNAGVPRIFLECLKIQILQTGIESTNDKGKTSTSWVYSGCDILLDNTGNKAYWTVDNMIDKFSCKILTSVDVNKLKTIPRYTNDENEIAVNYIKRPNAFLQKSEPQLPDTWKMFFGNGRFIDEHMDKLKIAHFIDNVLNANYSGRQSLVIGGEGDDGKGTFIKVINNIIGDKLSVSMNVTDFSNEDRFGLSKIFNKKLLVVPECKYVTKLFAADKFKSVTGSDPVTLEFKGQKAFNFNTNGVCIAICTNNPFYVNSEHGRTRVMPLVFKKNYDIKSQMDKDELFAKLISEKDQFIQWCIDYKHFYKEKVPYLFHGNALTMCTDEDVQNIGLIDDTELFKNMCEKQVIGDKKLCNWNEFTQEEENTFNVFNEIVTDMCYYILNDSKNIEKFVDDTNGSDKGTWIKTTHLIKELNVLLQTDRLNKPTEQDWIPRIASVRDKTVFRTNDKDINNFFKNLNYRQYKYFDKERICSVIKIDDILNNTKYTNPINNTFKQMINDKHKTVDKSNCGTDESTNWFKGDTSDVPNELCD